MQENVVRLLKETIDEGKSSGVLCYTKGLFFPQLYSPWYRKYVKLYRISQENRLYQKLLKFVFYLF